MFHEYTIFSPTSAAIFSTLPTFPSFEVRLKENLGHDHEIMIIPPKYEAELALCETNIVPETLGLEDAGRPPDRRYASFLGAKKTCDSCFWLGKTT